MAIPPPSPYTRTATDDEIQLYSQVVGSLTYPASITRPDIAFCTKCLAQNLKNPGPRHLEAAYRCVDYLEDTKFLALEYGGDVTSKPVFSASTDEHQKSHDQDSPPVFMAASDAAFADDELTRKSSEGYALKLFNGLFDWVSRLQSTVTTSTTEAELLAIAHLISWMLWWARFFDNIDLDIDQSLTAYCDNLQTIGLLLKDSPKLVTKLKHVDIQQHWLRQETAKGNVQIEWQSTTEMVADGLTKPLTIQRHNIFVKMINMVDVSSRVNRLTTPKLGGQNESDKDDEGEREV